MSNILDTSELGIVRRFEAAGFRAWPAERVHYDGTWVIRLTQGHSAKRLNSVNPLDPGDARDLSGRITRAADHFSANGRSLVFRMSPLGGPVLGGHLDREGWERFSDSMVMMTALDEERVMSAISHIPLKDASRFVDAALKVHGLGGEMRPGLAGLIGAIKPETGLFAIEENGEPVATLICVHDGDLAGLFEVATAAGSRGRGYGRRIVLSALKWAKLRGARVGWLQVEVDNTVAVNLYRSLGFFEAYGYHYRRPLVSR